MTSVQKGTYYQQSVREADLKAGLIAYKKVTPAYDYIRSDSEGDDDEEDDNPFTTYIESHKKQLRESNSALHLQQDTTRAASNISTPHQ